MGFEAPVLRSLVNAAFVALHETSPRDIFGPLPLRLGHLKIGLLAVVFASRAMAGDRWRRPPELHHYRASWLDLTAQFAGAPQKNGFVTSAEPSTTRPESAENRQGPLAVFFSRDMHAEKRHAVSRRENCHLQDASTGDAR
jgi:hypothetical protein